MSTTTCPNHIHFDYSVCTSCGYDAGPNNGWFGSPVCTDCKQDADRMANGWTPENSLS